MSERGIRCNHCKEYFPSVSAIRAHFADLYAGNTTPVVVVEPTEPVQPKRVPVTEDGLYVLDGQPVKVVWNQTGTRLYAKVYEGGRWEYAAGLLRDLNVSMAMTAEQASAFGKLYGRCVNCNRVLTHEVSIYWGYGEQCASNQGWTWHDVPEAHVTAEIS